MFKKLLGNMFVFSVFSLLLGSVLLLYPALSERIICYSVAVFCAVYGLVHIALHFMAREDFTFPLDLILGLLSIALGIGIILFPIIIIKVLPIILGSLMCVDGLMKIINSFDLLKTTFKKCWLIFFMGVGSIALGVLMIVYPFKLPILQFIGISFVVNGCFDVINMFVIAKYKK